MNANFLIDSKGYGKEGNYQASEPQSFNVAPFSRAQVQQKFDKNTGEPFVTACFFLRNADADGNMYRYAKISKSQSYKIGDEIPLDKVQAITLTDKRTGEVLKDPRIVW